MVRWSDVFIGWVGGGGGDRVPAWPPSPESCTCFRKLLSLISSPSEAANPRFLVKVIEMERNCLNAYRNFSLRGLTSIEYDSNSCVTESFDLSIWSFVEEKPHCKRPKGQPVDCPLSGQWPPRAGGKKRASTCSRFLQRILPAPGSHCMGTSWPRGPICVSVFNSSRWTFLPWFGLMSPVIFLASITSDSNESHSVAMRFMKKCVCVYAHACACVLNLFPLLSTSCSVRNKGGMSWFWVLPIAQAVTLSHLN